MTRQLSDLGQSARTMSSAVSAQGPSLADLLGNTQLDNLGQARVLEAAMQEAQQQNPNLLQQILSPRGAAGGIGTLLAGILGGGQAAAAFGSGALSGLTQQVEAQRTARDQAIEQLQKQRDKALERVDKSQQRISTLIESNPDLFNDPVTGEPTISPDKLGFLATGEDIRLDPSSRRALNNKDLFQQQRQDALMVALKESDNIEQTRTITEAMFKNMGWDDMPDKVVNDVTQAMGTPDLNAVMAGVLKDLGGVSGANAIIYARENGLAFDDPKVLNRVNWREKLPDGMTETDLKVQLMGEMAQWEQRPGNQDMLRTIDKEAAGDQKKRNELLAAEVWAGDSGKRTEWIDMTSGWTDGRRAMLARAITEGGAMTTMLKAIGGIKELQENKDAPPEKIAQITGKYIGLYLDAYEKERKESAVTEDVLQLNSMTTRIQRELNTTQSAASDLAGRVLKNARAIAVRENATPEEYRRIIADEVQKAIDANKE